MLRVERHPSCSVPSRPPVVTVGTEKLYRGLDSDRIPRQSTCHYRYDRDDGRTTPHTPLTIPRIRGKPAALVMGGARDHRTYRRTSRGDRPGGFANRQERPAGPAFPT